MATVKEIKDCLLKVLQTPLGHKIVIVVPLGTAYNIINRVRVELSRIRSKLADQGVKIARFKITTEVTIGPEHDTIVFVRVPEGGLSTVELGNLLDMLKSESVSGNGDGTNG